MTTRNHLEDDDTDPGSGGMSALFRQSQHAIRRFFERRLADRHDAEDLTQDSFVRLIERPDTAQMAHQAPYLYRVASNLAIDTARRRARSPVVPTAPVPVQADEEASDATTPREEISPERILAGRQELALVLAALDQLPAACRTAFLLQRVEGKNHAEIAALLGISRSMVEKHVARAMLHLRSALADSR